LESVNRREDPGNGGRKRLIDGVEGIKVPCSGIFGGMFRKQWISYCQ
jgi:hypothetical protein